jgi:hypothetical protein
MAGTPLHDTQVAKTLAAAETLQALGKEADRSSGDGAMGMLTQDNKPAGSLRLDLRRANIRTIVDAPTSGQLSHQSTPFMAAASLEVLSTAHHASAVTLQEFPIPLAIIEEELPPALLAPYASNSPLSKHGNPYGQSPAPTLTERHARNDRQSRFRVSYSTDEGVDSLNATTSRGPAVTPQAAKDPAIHPMAAVLSLGSLSPSAAASQASMSASQGSMSASQGSTSTSEDSTSASQDSTTAFQGPSSASQGSTSASRGSTSASQGFRRAPVDEPPDLINLPYSVTFASAPYCTMNHGLPWQVDIIGVYEPFRADGDILLPLLTSQLNSTAMFLEENVMCRLLMHEGTEIALVPARSHTHMNWHYVEMNVAHHNCWLQNLTDTYETLGAVQLIHPLLDCPAVAVKSSVSAVVAHLRAELPHEASPLRYATPLLHTCPLPSHLYPSSFPVIRLIFKCMCMSFPGHPSLCNARARGLHFLGGHNDKQRDVRKREPGGVVGGHNLLQISRRASRKPFAERLYGREIVQLSIPTLVGVNITLGESLILTLAPT